MTVIAGCDHSALASIADRQSASCATPIYIQNMSLISRHRHRATVAERDGVF